ncbi:MAG: UDP-2,3-diacylglucosamine diphosphatase [Candidatus Endonucleobacter bathymodioli]|uniref:UDP-2,3-diacylglucosamine hydrolase n=1 Tax=Candidatus Endonucleibacter bathymodioli TaxID=539814 RepID=A0AA90NR25_9GAMM|nr:UDP-2,3-diacylglucosamine diphosphatase [Candidatus Endonucleobacter bathymodioli]
MQALLISDLHLTPLRPAIAQAFLSFLKKQAVFSRQLYILGDFFEYWVGDDAMEPFHENIASSLKEYSRAGHDIYIMPGNRDFAIGQQFLKQAGAQWLSDPTLLTINGEKVLLLHGDSLCTEDIHYLRYRKIIRNPLIMALLQLTPLSFRKKLCHKIQKDSLQAKTKKKLAIMDVTENEVIRVMNHYNVNIMIHGHTHRPTIHDMHLSNGSPAKRYVLGDWESKGWFIRTDNIPFTLESFDISQYN